MGKQRDSDGRSVELLWAGRGQPARGPKPAFSLDDIAGAGIAVADAEGIGALTMARVAARLGVTPMALYRYVPGKNELLDLMTDAALGPPPPPGTGDWRAETARWAQASLARFRTRPWLIETAQRRVPIGPHWLGWLDAGLAALAGSGLPDTELVPAVMLVDGHVRATAQLAVGAATTARWAADFARALEAALGDPRFPALTRVAAAGGFAATGSDDAFAFGLQRVLDGIAARASQAAAP
ncbi:MAG: TetR/AcrR family transcriptional regulator C-terminal domain-containing protein [Gemmatirosa sp.]|nr:TetR/AcrR family transcriptional regulator C-terminal domain-containing protein [Gemmatirosa sp.]